MQGSATSGGPPRLTSGFLVDTNVLSEYNRGDRTAAGVNRWLEKTPQKLQFVSVMTLAEVQKGIELLAEGRRKNQLHQWLKNDLEAWFSERILLVDRRVGERWATLVAGRQRAGRTLPMVDSLIAATALVHDLTVVTRNTRDFEGSGIATLNPWL